MFKKIKQKSIRFALYLVVALTLSVMTLVFYINGTYVDHKLLRFLADSGNAYAQRELATLYTTREFILPNYNEAAKWYMRAAENGDVKAQDAVGLLYAKGQGVPQDYEKAFMWFSKAADQGYAPSQNDIGSLYSLGYGVKQDDNIAMK